MKRSLFVAALACVAVTVMASSAIARKGPRYTPVRRPVPIDSKEALRQGPAHFGRYVPVASGASTPAAHPMGTTYYDLQHNASTGRQVDETNGKIEATWMKAPYPSDSVRTVNWDRTSINGPAHDVTLDNGDVVRYLWIGTDLMQEVTFGAVRPGFTNLRHRANGKAVVIYHDAPQNGGIQFNETQLDLTAGNGIFSAFPSMMPMPPDFVGPNAFIWPKQAISTCGSDMIHHTIGTWSGGATEVWYWRGIINDAFGSISWAPGEPSEIDALSAGVSAIVEAQGQDVYIVMAKHVNSSLNADLVYYHSSDCGTTWGNPVNVTQLTNADPEGLWSEVGALIDDAGEIHVIYNTVPASGETAPVNLYHWSPTTGVRMITSAVWSDQCTAYPDLCAIMGGACPSREPIISEPIVSIKPAGLHGIAEELLFAVWTQYGPSDSDCATINESGALGGVLNGEIYVSVSSDGGLTWDRPQNITGTETPDCLPGDCLSESWVSAAAKADSGLYLSYVEDRHAGAAVSGQGAWTQNNYMVLAPETRLPVPEARLSVSPVQWIDLHADPGAGTPEEVELLVQNLGTATLQFQVTVAPDESGPTYVTVNGSSSYSSTIAAGGAAEPVLIQYHANSLPDPSEHNWRLEITSNDPESNPGQGGSPVDVNLQVFAASVWNACASDTLSTLMHRLQISSCLELGGQGYPGVGFFGFGDSSDWLASGSPVITRASGGSPAYDNVYLSEADRTRTANRSFRAQSPLFVARDTVLPSGFPGAEHMMPADLAWGSASTTDSTIGLEYRYVLPRSAALSDGAYLTLEMYNRTGSPIAGLTFGALADFDVTSMGAPEASENMGMATYVHGMIGARGGSADTSGIFIPNTNYITLFALAPGGGCYHLTGGSGRILDNAFYLHPAGHFIPDSLRKLFDTFGASGFWVGSPHIDTGQEYADVSALLVYAHNKTLGTADTLRWGFGLATSDVSFSDLEDKVRDLRQSASPDSIHCCMIAVPGDVNGSATISSADIIYLLGYCFKGGPMPSPCPANGDVNCSGAVTSADVIHLVNYCFKSGIPPCDICNDSPMTCGP